MQRVVFGHGEAIASKAGDEQKKYAANLRHSEKKEKKTADSRLLTTDTRSRQTSTASTTAQSQSCMSILPPSSKSLNPPNSPASPFQSHIPDPNPFTASHTHPNIIPPSPPHPSNTPTKQANLLSSPTAAVPSQHSAVSLASSSSSSPQTCPNCETTSW